MNAADLMSNDVTVVDIDTTVADAAALMRDRNTGCLVVTEGGAPVGIITERDMALGCLIDGHISWQCHVYRHMTLLSETASLHTGIGEALLAMMDAEVGHMPVVDGEGRVAGLLFAEDLSRAIEQDGEPTLIMDDDMADLAAVA